MCKYFFFFGKAEVLHCESLLCLYVLELSWKVCYLCMCALKWQKVRILYLHLFTTNNW